MQWIPTEFSGFHPVGSSPRCYGIGSRGESQAVSSGSAAGARTYLFSDESGNLHSDVAIVYGIDPGPPGRIQTWRGRGCFIHVMTDVSWGNYQEIIGLNPGSRYLLPDCDADRGPEPALLAVACKVFPSRRDAESVFYLVEGAGRIPAVMLLNVTKPPRSVTLGGKPGKKCSANRRTIIYFGYPFQTKPTPENWRFNFDGDNFRK